MWATLRSSERIAAEVTMALEVIGAGWGRTGTESLKVALEKIERLLQLAADAGELVDACSAPHSPIREG
jgi:hypothetical protein